MKQVIIERPDKVFFTADTHFNHTNIIYYCDRPYKDASHMNESLIENWNQLVDTESLIFILGDFAYGDKRDWENLLGRLHGRKFLIKGNHDRSNCIPSHKFLEVHEGFAKIYVKDPDSHREIILCHYPMLSWEHSHKGSWQLYGHWHGSKVRKREVGDADAQKEVSEYVKNESIAYMNTRATQYDVGVDNNNYYPIGYYDIKAIINKRLNEEKGKAR